MKKICTFCILCFAVIAGSAQTTLHTFHDFSSVTINGDTVNLSQYYGKKVMAINCASFCNYTPQYTPLEELYDSFQRYNFEIIGWPSNDFLNQGGTDSQIITTCHNYNVSFPIMETVHVASGAIDPIFQWLEHANQNGVSNATVTWNFNKFLIDEAGHWVKHFTQATDPMDTAITNWIMSPSVIQTTAISKENIDNLIEFKSSNPTASSIDFTVKNSTGDRMQVNLYSIDGKLINTLFNSSASDIQNISYPVASLPSGLYLIRINAKDAQKTIKYSVVK